MEPQECAPPVVREAYRNTVEEQVMRAYLSGCSVLIAEDSNAKLGPQWIKDDPHPMSDNGRLLSSMILRQGLTIINKSEKCSGGPITRRRILEDGKEEASCIDFMIVSHDLVKHLDSSFIDKQQLYSLTKYTTTKGITSIKRSDHFTIVANFCIDWKEEKPKRKEVFKFRDNVGLQKFQQLTSTSDHLLKCFQSNLTLHDSCKKWFKEFEKLIHLCFKKIRITETPPKSTIDYSIHKLLSDLKQIKLMLSSATEMSKPVLELEAAMYEKKIAEAHGEKCKRTIKEQTKDLKLDEAFNPNAAWKLKKKLFPKSTDPPFAIYNKDKELVTNTKEILGLMKEEFTHRLRNREINPEFKELQEIKEYLCKLRLEITRRSEFVPWKMSDLVTAVNKLKNNKCKDPHGHVNELYKHLGLNGMQSLLTFLNRIKEEIIIPGELKLSNVSTIYKGKGSKREVLNLRGIFKLPIVRNILDRLIYKDDHEQINVSMGPFQVGNQKRRSIRDHALVVHAVVNEAKANKRNLDLLLTDIKQCFDSIWLDESINDLYNSGVTSRNLNLLYEGNKSTSMLVETNFGRSQRVTLHKIVMQGSVPGGTLCSNQISKLCNKSFSEGDVYMYDGIPIPALAMVDDIVSIAKCNSVEGVVSNVKTDEFIKRKKLESQVGEGKCQWVHIGSKTCRCTYVANGSEITQALSYKYLGDHLSDGWETLYKKRQERATGYAVSCQAMATEISLGFQIYAVVKLLHQAIFLNGSLVNMETWPHCNEKRISTFERTEQGLFRKILSAHSKTPVECLYLELGVVPFRYHLKIRRIMYYQTIMKRDDEEITKKIVESQKRSKIKGDFYVQVSADMNELQITENDITASKAYLKEKVNMQAKKHAFTQLHKLAVSHSKVDDKLYENLYGMEYFNDSRFSPDLRTSSLSSEPGCIK